MSNQTDKAILAIAKAFDDGRGLDGHLVQELNLPFDDFQVTVARVSAILAAYTVAPAWIKTAMLGAGAAVLSDMPPSIATIMFQQAQADDAMKKLVGL